MILDAIQRILPPAAIVHVQSIRACIRKIHRPMSSSPSAVGVYYNNTCKCGGEIRADMQNGCEVCTSCGLVASNDIEQHLVHDAPEHKHTARARADLQELHPKIHGDALLMFKHVRNKYKRLNYEHALAACVMVAMQNNQWGEQTQCRCTD